MKKKESILLLICLSTLQLQISCVNYSTPETKQLRTSAQQYSTYRSKASLARIEAINRSAIANQSGCVQLHDRQVFFGQVSNDYISRERAVRELNGGPSCKCVPMGTSCFAGSCLCSEICPNDERILSSRANQIAPAPENLFPFTNSSNHDNTVFINAPNNNGYCTGFAEQRRRFSLLADFRPDLITIPAMNIPSYTWVEYTKNQIRRMAQRETPTFIGISNLEDLNRAGPEYQELKRFFMETMQWDEWNSAQARTSRMTVSNPVTNQMFTLNPIFRHQNETRFNGQDAIDPLTNELIPEQGTVAYQNYIRNQIRSVMRGNPAPIPGYSNLQSVASNPTYAELIGDEIAREWRETNDLNHAYFYGEGPRDITRLDNSTRVMNASEINLVWNDIAENIPPNTANYPQDASGNGWNHNGPYGTLTIAIVGVQKDSDGKILDTSRHAIEAYAHTTEPDGTRIICVVDPNFRNNDSCQNKITIPVSGKPTYNGLSTWGSGWELGTFDLYPTAFGRQGQMITQNIQYCRRINQSRFAANDCTN